MTDRPPTIIEHKGWRYRRVGQVGVRLGRPPKESRIIDGETCWLCPCCEEWKSERDFHANSLAANGLQSWCINCVREDRIMRRAIGRVGDAAFVAKGIDDE